MWWGKVWWKLRLWGGEIVGGLVVEGSGKLKRVLWCLYSGWVRVFVFSDMVRFLWFEVGGCGRSIVWGREWNKLLWGGVCRGGLCDVEGGICIVKWLDFCIGWWGL